MKKRHPQLIIFLLVAAAYLSGMFTSVDRVAMDGAFEIARRDAAGLVVLVEVDRKSLRQLKVWPWVRTYHAKVLDRLVQADVWSVAFDVDFSSRTVAAHDRALAKALRGAKDKVVLPVFKRRIRNSRGREIETFSVPSSVFGRNARLASVNVLTDADGKVRRYPANEQWRGKVLPTLAAELAANRDKTRHDFFIDYGIRPDTIPRLSFVDVLRGDFDPSVVAGKVVIIGATAPDLGEWIPVPVHGVLADPVLHALAYESIAQGRTIVRASPWITLVVGLMILAFTTHWYSETSLRKGAVAAAASVPVLFLANAGLLWLFPFSLDVTPLSAMALLSYVGHAMTLIDLRKNKTSTNSLANVQRRAMLNSLVDDNLDGIVIANDRGIVQLFNPMASRLIGVSGHSVVGRPIGSVVPEFAPIFTGKVVAHAHGKAEPVARPGTPHELKIKRSDGKEFVAEMVITESALEITKDRPFGKNPNRLVHILTFRDITERKRVERAEREALEHAIAANRAKSEFLANVSHELRTPLNAIIGFSEILQQEMFGALGAPRYKEYVGDIHNSGVHLLDVINDILDMSKIEAGEMRLQETDVDMARVVRSCTRLINERAKSAGLSVSAEVPDDLPLLQADSRLLKQILLNLLSNAVKFTPADGQITVTCRMEKDGGFSFSVSDTGIGIPAESIDKVLAPFGQVDTGLQRKYEGTGLGLPLVKSMAELHGGGVQLESTPKSGTTVTITLPAKRVTDRKADASTSEDPTPTTATG